MGVDLVSTADGKTFKNPYVGRTHPDKKGIVHPVYKFEYAKYYYYRNGGAMHFVKWSEL